MPNPPLSLNPNALRLLGVPMLGVPAAGASQAYVPAAGTNAAHYTPRLGGNSVVNVKDYGAKGDDGTDDTAAFTAAIAVLPAGGELLIPDGTYVVSGPLVIPVSCRVRGVGIGYYLGRFGASGYQASPGRGSTVKCTSPTAVCFDLQGSSGSIYDLAILNTASTTPSAGCGIRLSYALGHPGDSTYLAAKVDLSRVVVAGFYDGIVQCGGVYWHMHNCGVADVRRYGLDISNIASLDAGDWTVESCNFINVVAAAAAIHVRGSGGGMITGCKINGGGGPGLAFSDGILLDLAAGVQTGELGISLCKIANVLAAPVRLTSAAGAVFSSIRINDNILRSSAGPAVFIDNGTGSGANGSILGTQINDNAIICDDGVSHAVVVNGGYGVSIDGNYISGAVDVWTGNGSNDVSEGQNIVGGISPRLKVANLLFTGQDIRSNDGELRRHLDHAGTVPADRLINFQSWADNVPTLFQQLGSGTQAVAITGLFGGTLSRFLIAASKFGFFPGYSGSNVADDGSFMQFGGSLSIGTNTATVGAITLNGTTRTSWPTGGGTASALIVGNQVGAADVEYDLNYNSTTHQMSVTTKWNQGGNAAAGVYTFDKDGNTTQAGTLTVGGPIYGAGEINLWVDGGSPCFRGLRANGWLDAAAAQFFQVGDSSGSAVFTARNGTQYQRLLFDALHTQFTANGYSIAPVPVDRWEWIGGGGKVAGLTDAGNLTLAGTLTTGTNQISCGGIKFYRAGGGYAGELTAVSEDGYLYLNPTVSFRMFAGNMQFGYDYTSALLRLAANTIIAGPVTIIDGHPLTLNGGTSTTTLTVQTAGTSAFPALNLDNQDGAGGKRWSLIGTGAANGEGPGLLSFYNGTDLSLAATLDGAGGFTPGSSTVATLPTPGTGRNGRIMWASDALKPGESPGSGTGRMVQDDGTNWVTGDGLVVAA